jgi:hypothetical protein
VRRRGARILGCVEGGSGEAGRDDGGILGASREAVGSPGARRRRDLGCIEGGSGEPGRDGGGILGASREAVGSWDEMAVCDAGDKQI